jgi:hypothetical protein
MLKLTHFFDFVKDCRLCPSTLPAVTHALYKETASWSDYYDCRIQTKNLLLNYYDWQQTGDGGADGHCHEGAFMQTDEYCESSCNQAIKDGFKFAQAANLYSP